MKKKNNPDKMIDILKNPKRVYIKDQDDKLYYNPNNSSELIPLDSGTFKEESMAQYYDKYQTTSNPSAFEQALTTLKGLFRIQRLNRSTLFIRVGKSNGDYYHSLSKEKAIKISSGGWNVTKNVPPIFKSFSHQADIPEPDLKSSIPIKDRLDLVFKYIRVKTDNEKHLVISALISSLVADIPHPILLFLGPQGSSKTTATMVSKRLIDPVGKLKGFRLPKTDKDFILMASQHHVLPIENMPIIKQNQSDLFCTAVTGDALSVRKLYTDSYQIIHRVQCCLVLNGINLPSSKSDFLDRSIIFNLDRIPEDQRMDETELNLQLDIDIPIMLGAMYKVFANAIQIKPNIILKRKPRMADFALWGCAIAEARGLSKDVFMDAYYENIALINDEVIDQNPLLKTVVSFMDNKSTYKDSPSKLRKKLIEHAKTNSLDIKDFPVDGSSLSKRLEELSHNLKSKNITIKKGKSGSKRYLILSKKVSKGQKSGSFGLKITLSKP